MQLKSSLFVALVAGSVGSVAMAQQLQALPARGQPVQGTFAKATVNGVKINPGSHSGSSDAVAVYKNDGTAPFYATNGLPGKAGDHCKFTPGPGSAGPVKLTSIDKISFIGNGPAGYPGGSVDLVLDIFDTYNTAATPIESVQLLHFVGNVAGLPAVPAGTYYTFGPIDITANNITVPDDDFVAVVKILNAGTTVAATGLMPTFNGLPYPLTIGASEDNFLLDADNNGVFSGNEWSYWFGGTDPFHSNLLLTFSGNYLGLTGACCLPDGTCSTTSGVNCAQLSGTYQGNGSLCTACGPVQTGRCCKPDGTCAVLSNFDCNTAHGVYGGNNTTCGGCVPFGFDEAGNDVGELPNTAAIITGPANTALTHIFGALTAGDTDMFQINICDRTNFTASVVGGAGGADTQMFLFDSAGKGVTMDDDNSTGAESNISGAFVTANGLYYIAIDLYNRDPIDSTASLLFNNTNPATAYFPEWAADGPGAANPIASWTGASGSTATYNITLTGACFISAGCYANCDGSTGTPALTANDFQCFLNKYAQADPYANCDGSTSTPLLTANDFQCFLNKYAQGCT